MKEIKILLLLVVWSSIVVAQRTSLIDNSLNIQVSDADISRLINEDSETEGLKDVPFRYGINIDTNIDLLSIGKDTIFDGKNAQVTRLIAPNAIALELKFGNFYLPGNSELYITDKAGNLVHRILSASDYKNDLTFMSSVIFCTDLLIYFVPDTLIKESPKLVLSNVIYAYRDIFKDESFKGCYIDINCEEGEAWQIEKKSVARVLLGSGQYCTGSLINNTAHDGTKYFLTANHCYNASPSPADWKFYFNYEAANCGSFSSWVPDVPGSVLRARNSASDFCLVEITGTIPSSAGIVFAGWDRSETQSDSVIVIHHPAGQGKKISKDFGGVINGNWSGTPENSHWAINYDMSSTEGGSSGSALFNKNRKIIGQLHGGDAACGNNLYDWYGKFSLSWDYGTTESTRLKDWLDPLNTGVTELDHYIPGSIECPDNLVVSIDSEPITLTGANPAGGVYTGDAVVDGVFDPSLAGLGVHIITYTYSTHICVFTITVEAQSNLLTVTVTEGITGNTDNGVIYGWASGTRYSLYQHIYKQNLINQSGEITHIQFENQMDGSFTNVKIYLAETSKSSFIANSDWVNAELSEVYSGSLNVVDGWYEIELDNSFEYNNTGNLLIVIHQSGGTTPNSSSARHIVAAADANVSLRNYSSSSLGALGSWNSTGSRQAVLPNLKLSFAVPIELTCPTDINTCENDEAFLLSGASPAGGNYNGEGVVDAVFYPSIGAGQHIITYEYNGQSCIYNINVAQAPTVTCPANLTISFGELVQFNGENPSGGIFSGQNVTNNEFNPVGLTNGDYVISYTYNDGNCEIECQFIVTVDISIGFNEHTDKSLLIYPVPSNDYINVAGLQTGSIEYKIFDISGKLVRCKTETCQNNHKIDIKDLLPGFYSVCIKNSNKSEVFRIIISK